MPGPFLYELGQEPKELAYIDNDTGTYIEKSFKLKSQITEEKLREFFNKIYSMRLDSGYSRSFGENHNTSDLARCFAEILSSNSVINLYKLFSIINDEEAEFPLPIMYAIKEFFSMFETTQEQEFGREAYDTMLRQSATNPLFRGKDSSFDKKQQMIAKNTQAMRLARSKGRGMVKMSMAANS